MPPGSKAPPHHSSWGICRGLPEESKAVVSIGSEVGQRKGPDHGLEVAPSTHMGVLGWAQESWVQVSPLGASVSPWENGCCTPRPQPRSLSNSC